MFEVILILADNKLIISVSVSVLYSLKNKAKKQKSKKQNVFQNDVTYSRKRGVFSVSTPGKRYRVYD